MRFLEQVAVHIKQNYPDFRKLHVILPSQRAKKYLQKELFQVFNRPIFSPKINTIDELIKLYHPNTIDKTRSLLELYAVHQQIESKIESFEEFTQWGQTVLNDFEDLDRHLVNSNDIFLNLKSIKELEAWQIDKPLSLKQQKFFSFWDKMGEYYDEFHRKISLKKQITLAKAYKTLAEDAKSIDDEYNYLFVGFNALTKSESLLVKNLTKRGIAEFLVDADSYYFEDKLHEGGMFIRQALKEIDINKPKYVQHNLKKKKIDIKIIESPQYTGQVKVAADYISSLDESSLNQTAIILADESLISAVLHGLPENINKANITLGSPLRETPIKSWVENIFSIQENIKVFKTKSLYHVDLFRTLQHVFFQTCVLKKDYQSLSKVELETKSRNKIFQSMASINLPSYLHDLLSTITLDWKNDWRLAINQIRLVNKKLIELIPDGNEYELSCVISFDNALISFQKIVMEGLPEMTLKSFKMLLNQHWKNEQLAFQGTITDGLQIMGILESRLLDFKNIVMIGFNEGNLPSNNRIDSIIPIDLRSAKGLPTTRNKQGVFAHHFYRLLHQAQNLVCTYASTSDSITNNEKSRFLLQLEYELAVDNKNVSIEKLLYNLPLNNPSDTKTSILKSIYYKSQINEFFESSISASAINKYLKCPLDFYYRYILGFEESNEIEELIESHNFGTFIHSTLEKLYRPFCQHDDKGVKIQPPPPPLGLKEIDSMLQSYPGVLLNEYMAYFKNDEKLFQKGRNKLSFEIAMLTIEKFLLAEKQYIDSLNDHLFIEYLEISLHADIAIKHNSDKKRVKLKGIIDRIDRIKDNYRIIDYKTGKASLNDVRFNKTSKSNNKSAFGNTSHALQLSFYTIMFEQKFGFLPFQTIIKSLIKPNRNYDLQMKNGDIRDILDSSVELLGELYAEMLDEEIHIVHDEKSKYCKFCE